jgi:hypothetical protein
MQKTSFEVNTPEKVGEILKVRREAEGISLATVAARAGGEASTIFHWEKGREGGCCQVARVALALGLTPDKLLLKESGQEDAAAAMVKPALSADMRRIVVGLLLMDKLCAGAPHPPVKVFADHIDGLNRSFLERPAGPLLEPGELPPKLRGDLAGLGQQLDVVLGQIPSDSLLGRTLDSLLSQIADLRAPRKRQSKAPGSQTVQDPAAAYGSGVAVSGAPRTGRKAGRSGPSNKPPPKGK